MRLSLYIVFCGVISARFISSVFGPVGAVYAILVFAYYLMISTFGKLIAFCTCNRVIKGSTVILSDSWEAIRFKQTKMATFLRTGLLIQGLFFHVSDIHVPYTFAIAVFRIGCCSFSNSSLYVRNGVFH